MRSPWLQHCFHFLFLIQGRGKCTCLVVLGICLWGCWVGLNCSQTDFIRSGLASQPLLENYWCFQTLSVGHSLALEACSGSRVVASWLRAVKILSLRRKTRWLSQGLIHCCVLAPGVPHKVGILMPSLSPVHKSCDILCHLWLETHLSVGGISIEIGAQCKPGGRTQN